MKEKEIKKKLEGKRLLWEDDGFAQDDPNRKGSFVIGAVEGVGPNREVYMVINESLDIVEVLGANVVKELVTNGRYERRYSEGTRVYTLGE